MFLALAAFSLKATLILAAAALAAACLKRASAAARHLIWTAATAAIVALPLLSVSLPRWHVALPAAPDITFAILGTSSFAPAAAPPPVSATLTAAPAAFDWQSAATAVWSAGTLLFIASIGLAYLRLARKRSRAAAFRGSHPSPIPVLEAEPGSMPVLFGLLHPVVFLPADAAQWSEERRQMVLLHELAHWRRADVLTQLIARAALSLCWWNPLAWRAWRASLEERERAADDLVLGSGALPSTYAGHLLELARTLRPAPATASAAVAMARGSELERRLASILDATRRRTPPSRGWALAMMLLALPLAAFQAAQADVDRLISAAVSQGSFLILDDAAQGALDAQRFDEAKKLLEASLALRTNPADRGAGLFRLGVLASRLDRSGEARSYYERAAQAWAGRPEAARALLKLAVDAIGAKEYARAFELAEQAKRTNSAQSAEAFLWMAVVRRAEGNNAEAAAHFRAAMAVQDAESADAIPVGLVYADFLRSEGREPEAAQLDILTARLRKQAAPAATPRSAGIERIGGAVNAPKLLAKVEPKYSAEARAAKLTGSSVLFVEVHPDGRARNIQVVNPIGLGLDDRAREAVSQWRFEPGTKDGQPVPVAATIEVKWKLL